MLPVPTSIYAPPQQNCEVQYVSSYYNNAPVFECTTKEQYQKLKAKETQEKLKASKWIGLLMLGLFAVPVFLMIIDP